MVVILSGLDILITSGIELSVMTRFPYRVHISPSVISQQVLLGETILMDVESLAYFGLDELGSRIWNSLQTCDDAQQVFDGLTEATGIDEEALATKYEGVLKGLEISRIISLELQGPG